MRAATSTLTARLIAEWMSFVGWLHTAVRKDSRALALFADTEDPAEHLKTEENEAEWGFTR